MIKPQEFLNRIVESSEDNIIGEDLNGGITLWNGAAERMFRILPNGGGRPVGRARPGRLAPHPMLFKEAREEP
jgi:PAS domain-containing protein